MLQTAPANTSVSAVPIALELIPRWTPAELTAIAKCSSRDRRAVTVRTYEVTTGVPLWPSMLDARQEDVFCPSVRHSGGSSQRRARVCAYAFHHRAETVGALRGEVLAKPHSFEQRHS